jgi:hypothetical protein
MPRTVDEGFRDFLSRLTPTGSESAAASSHRASIEACLKDNFGLRRFARIGSFGNGTSVSGYSDVDYLASIPGDKLSSNSDYSLRKIREALDARFPNTGVRVDCPAVCVPFGGTAADRTEVVPAHYIGDERDRKVYDIADCAGGWMRASPDAHNAYVADVDGRLGGKVKPLVRFIKAWKYFCNVPVSSFYLELRVAMYAEGEKAIIYDMDVKRVLKLLSDVGLADMQDPMGVSGLIRACKTADQRADALSKLGTALGRAEKARVAAEAGNVSDAFDWWRLAYNYEFPTYYY